MYYKNQSLIIFAKLIGALRGSGNIIGLVSGSWFFGHYVFGYFFEPPLIIAAATYKNGFQRAVESGML